MFNMKHQDRTNAWPGFVDLFSNLVIILIFLLIVFVFLWTTTSVFNKNTGARKLAVLEAQRKHQEEQIAQMTIDKTETDKLLQAAKLALRNQENQILHNQSYQENLTKKYEDKIAQMQKQQQEMATMQAQQLAIQKQQLEAQIAELTTKLNQAISDKQEMSRIESERHEMHDDMVAKNAELNTKIDELTNEIAKLNAALDAAEETAKQQDIEYIEMSNRLNKALADKVAELSSLSQYQSEFYKQIKLALKDNKGVKQDGDRFIVSSDILFPSGAYKISADGQKQLQILADVIKNFESKIPNDIDWIIRVDGHTDSKPVIKGTPGYKNNMELSLLRATAVVNELVKDGVSRRRLIPSGFGELYPVAKEKTPAALQRNRRIELQLTNK